MAGSRRAGRVTTARWVTTAPRVTTARRVANSRRVAGNRVADVWLRRAECCRADVEKLSQLDMYRFGSEQWVWAGRWVRLPCWGA